MGHHLLAVPGVTLGKFLHVLISPSLGLVLCGPGRTAAPPSEGSSTRAVTFYCFVQWCLEQRPHLVSTGCCLLNE